MIATLRNDDWWCWRCGYFSDLLCSKDGSMVTGWGMKLEVKRPEGLFPVLPLTRCDLSQITSPLCASVFLFVKWVIMLPHLCKVLWDLETNSSIQKHSLLFVDGYWSIESLNLWRTSQWTDRQTFCTPPRDTCSTEWNGIRVYLSVIFMMVRMVLFTSDYLWGSFKP